MSTCNAKIHSILSNGCSPPERRDPPLLDVKEKPAYELIQVEGQHKPFTLVKKVNENSAKHSKAFK